MQTILGAGGGIGTPLAEELRNFTSALRLVSRNPKSANASDECVAADLLNKTQVMDAVRGSDVVYLTAGLVYNSKIWEAQWPVIMRNVLDACEAHKAKLLFFDNVYGIGGDNVKHITEESPLSPVSKKGTVRAALDRMILEASDKGKVQSIIARCADYFGPVPDNRSPLIETVYKNLKNAKAAYWFCDADVKHSVTYVPDAAKAVALLGNTPDAYNQIWNLPTSAEAPTGRQWIELFAAELRTPPKTQILSRNMCRLLGLFVPVLRESVEMLYQYDRDYVFDSAKFSKRFNIQPTTPKDAVRQTVAVLAKTHPAQ
jgi:nucleoside-diphosphate-sugar epimerase